MLRFSPLLFSGFSSQLMLHSATQATLSSILLSGVQGYTQSTPSPPPGLAPIDKQPNGVPDCAKGPCTLNGHVKVSPIIRCWQQYFRLTLTSCWVNITPSCMFFLPCMAVSVHAYIACWLSLWEDSNRITCRNCSESSPMWLSPGGQWTQSSRTAVQQVQPRWRYLS